MKTSTLKIFYNLLVLGAGLGIALLWAGQAMTPAGEGDIWFARALGRALSDPSGFPLFEAFSHTIAADQVFKAGGWLWAVLVYQLGQGGPAWALQAWRLAAMGGIFIFLVTAAYRRGARPFSSSLAALLALLPLWNADLAFLSVCVLLALSIYIMEGPFWASLFSRWLWLAPLLALASNLHAAALSIGLLAGAWALSDKDLPTTAPPDNPWLARFIFAAALLSCLALNFNGFGLWSELLRLPWKTPHEVLAPEVLLLFSNTALSLLLPAIALFFLLANLWVSGGQRRWRRDMVCGLSLAALMGLRPDWLPLLALWSAPVAAARLDAVVDALGPGVRQARWLIKIPVLIALLWTVPALKADWRSRPAYARRGMPDRVIAFLREQNPGTRFYNPLDWSGYLLWYLPNRVQVFLDPRGPLAFSATVLSDYIGAASGGLGGSKNQLELWREIFNRRKIEAAMLRVHSPLARTMARASGWQPVSFDNESVLYVRDDKAHKAMIKIWAPRGLRPGDLKEPFDPSRLQQTEADLEMRLARDPDMGILYLFQSATYRQRNDLEGARKSLRRGIQLDPFYAPNYQWLGLELVEQGKIAEARKWWKKSLRIKEDPQVREWLRKYQRE